MCRLKSSGKTRRFETKRRHSRLARASFCLIALASGWAASGCRSPQHTGGDPLMGPVNPPGINGQPLPAQTPTKAAAHNDAPTAPLSQLNNTPAGLVNNTQIPQTKPLTIGDPQAGPNWQLTNTTKDNAGKTPTVVPVPKNGTPAPPGITPTGVGPGGTGPGAIAPTGVVPSS